MEGTTEWLTSSIWTPYPRLFLLCYIAQLANEKAKTRTSVSDAITGMLTTTALLPFLLTCEDKTNKQTNERMNKTTPK